ncbi:LPXTG cell wall anchor domain-containing protein [Thermoactinomyces sp. DSM 45892]|uniref:LPXTG cell wall anchor domain-containing protein n=1 Tax=Thermoactinomyces sp. DSM 45892 TaxID=1882753 RepID=UPI00089B20AB|nr:LPXTG cell wall anchor domain-containing protein [Thermoactinomyces sp. DSM 45892]SDZ20049.1 LPXTG-motif cell wall anchor domain-containing protein [Thermoactinomyces sp. DSM 45892]
MKRMTKPFAVLATLALSVTAFQGVVAAEDTKPANPPTAPATTEQTPVDTKVEGKTSTTVEDKKAEGKTDAKAEDKKATEGKTSTTPAAEKDKVADKKKEVKQVEISITETATILKAELKGIKEAKGTWKLFIGKKEVFSAQGGSSVEFNYSNQDFAKKILEAAAEPGADYVLIQFEGTSNGTPIKGLVRDDLVKSLATTVAVKNGTLTVTGKLNGAKKAKGDWVAIVNTNTEFFKNGEPNKTIVDSQIIENGGLSSKFTFKDLKPGTYYVMLAFEGTVDGKEESTFDVMKVVVKKAGSTGSDKDAVEVTPVKKPVTKEATKQETKKAIEDAKGGKLPKTATSYPIATVAGAAVLMVGAGLFFVARRRKQKQQ